MMAEYVDKGKLYDAISDNWSGIKVCVTSDILEFINYTPTADVVEVVRCKDCKWHDSVDGPMRQCDITDDDDFCSYGEREGD